MSVIGRAANGFGYRADDHGNSVNTATALVVSNNQFSRSGIIGTTSDVDYFSFNSGAGNISLSVNVRAELQQSRRPARAARLQRGLDRLGLADEQLQRHDQRGGRRRKLSTGRRFERRLRQRGPVHGVGTVTTTDTYSLFDNGGTPAAIDSGDGQAIEVGVKIRSDVNGYITGLRFYKSAANTGTHTAHLWSSTGQLLATATFTSETASGWQQVNFATPVAISGRRDVRGQLPHDHRPLFDHAQLLRQRRRQRPLARLGQRHEQQRRVRLRPRRLPDAKLSIDQLLGRRGVHHHAAGRHHRADRLGVQPGQRSDQRRHEHDGDRHLQRSDGCRDDQLHDGPLAGRRDAGGGQRVVQRRHEHRHAHARRGPGQLEDLHDLGHRRRERREGSGRQRAGHHRHVVLHDRRRRRHDLQPVQQQRHAGGDRQRRRPGDRSGREDPLRRERLHHRAAVLQERRPTRARTPRTCGRARANCWPRPRSRAKPPAAGSR